MVECNEVYYEEIQEWIFINSEKKFGSPPCLLMSTALIVLYCHLSI